MVIGEVRDVGGARRAGVQVVGEWSRLLLAAGTAERDPRRVEATTARDGSFALCGLPLEGSVDAGGGASVLVSGEFTVRAEGPALASGAITLQLNGAGLVRRDLIAGGARRARTGGRVVDVVGRPIVDATVLLVGEDGRSVRTDSNGVWVLDSLPVRSSELLIRALRYLPLRVALDPVGGRMAVGEVRLERAAQVLAARTITATASATRAAFEFRRAAGVGTFLDESWIKQFPTITVATVRSAIRKTRLIVDPSEGEYGYRYKLAFETDVGPGSGPDPIGIMQACFPRWYIDGVDFGRPFATEEEQLLKLAKRIEAYRAMEMPVRYPDFDGCGVILIWTYDLP
jgi:hypothetical protein